MAKNGNNNLPAYTTVENILSLVETYKRKSNNEDEAKAIFGKAGSAYTNTKSALRTFELIEKDTLDFTAQGREVAYSQGDDKKSEISKILINYAPYESLLFGLSKKDDLPPTEVEEIVNFWGKASYGSTQRNREDGAKLFMSIVEFCGLGNYIIGRGKNSTRIEWAPDIKDKIIELNKSRTENTAPIQVDSIDEESKEDPIIATVPMSTEAISEQNSVSAQINNDTPPCQSGKQVRVSTVPQISINVDMSDWSDEKIKTFFKYAYGRFEED